MIRWEKDHATALARAKDEKRNVFLDFYSPG